MAFPLAAAKIPSLPQAIAVSAGAAFPALLSLLCVEQLPRAPSRAVPWGHLHPATLIISEAIICVQMKRDLLVFSSNRFFPNPT